MDASILMGGPIEGNYSRNLASNEAYDPATSRSTRSLEAWLEAMEGFDYGGEGFPERNSASASAF
jgi:hypothetical protein